MGARPRQPLLSGPCLYCCAGGKKEGPTTRLRQGPPVAQQRSHGGDGQYCAQQSTTRRTRNAHTKAPCAPCAESEASALSICLTSCKRRANLLLNRANVRARALVWDRREQPSEGWFMTVVCPICKSSAQEHLHTGDAAAFHCQTHGDFKVADSVLAEDYNRDQWEAALDKARQRAEPDEDEWPLIIVDDFC